MAYLPGWSKFIEGTIAAADMPSALSGFPVAVKISTVSGLADQDVSAVFDEIGSSWQKVAFQLGESASESYAEMEMWDSVNESGLFHVKFDLASGENKFRMYYDSTHADNTAYIGAVTSTPARAVWDSNSVCVINPSNPTATIYDSTGNANNASSLGSMTADDLVSNSYGFKALTLDGSDDGLLIADSNSLDITEVITAEVFMKINSTQARSYPVIIEKTPVNTIWLLLMDSNRKLISRLTVGNETSVTSSAYNDNTYHLFTFRYDRTTLECIVDGVVKASVAKTAAIATSSGGVYIGRDSASGNEINAELSFVRISNTKRSNAWLAATYKSLTDTLITYSGEQLAQTWGINGVVKAGSNLFPGAKVLLIDRVNLNIVSVTTAAETTAVYSFTGLNNGDAGRYATHIIDTTNTYNDVADSAITAEEE